MWPQDFIHHLVRWARALARMLGPAEVSWADLALDYEAFVGWALPASPDHRLRGTRLPLGERAHILRKAVGLAECHLAAGVMLSGAPLGRCRSLLPLGGRVCAGLSARPYFAACHDVMLQLMRLAARYHNSWARRLRAPARMRPLHSDLFLMDYFPRPLEGGLLCSRMPGGPHGHRPAASRSRHHSATALRGRAAARRARSAWSMGRRLVPGAGAWAGASAAAAGRATKATLAPRGPRLPHSPAPARAGSLGARPRGPTHGGGRAVLLAGTGPPGLPGALGLGPSGNPPMHYPAQSPRRSPFLRPGARRPQAREALGA